MSQLQVAVDEVRGEFAVGNRYHNTGDDGDSGHSFVYDNYV